MTRSAALVWTCVLICACSARAQESAPSDARARPEHSAQPEQAEQSDVERRAARRAWLARRLEEARAEQMRLEAAIKAVDAGEPLPQPDRSARGEGDRRRDGRRDDGDRGPGAPAGPAHEPTPEERTRIVSEFAARHFPEFAERLASERERNPDAVDRIAARFWPRISELIELEQADPDLFAVELERLRNGEQIMSAVWRARRDPPVDGAAREQLVASLRQLASRQFELRLAATRLRLEALRESVRETEEDLQQRESSRDADVAAQVDKLLRMIDREEGSRDRDDRRGGH